MYLLQQKFRILNIISVLWRQNGRPVSRKNAEKLIYGDIFL